MSKASTRKNGLVRAAVYARISSDRDERKLGVDDQERLCRAQCGKNGWTVIEPPYVDNDVSAANPRKRRPQYERMLADIRDGKVDAVVVWQDDRLHRQPRELESFVAACDEVGLSTLASVSSGEVNLNDADALMMLRIKGAMSAREVAKTGERTRRRKLDMAERGKYSGGSNRPFGYEKDGVTVRKSEAAEIRWAVKHVINGGSIYAVRHRWMDKDIATPTDRRTVDGKPKWSAMSVCGILTGPRIAGLRQHQGAVIGEAVWPAIVRREDWEAVRAILNDPSRRQKPPSRAYPLRGVLTCSVCGHHLTSMPRKEKRNYGCRKDGGHCGKVFISANSVEDFVIRVLVMLADSEAARAIIDAENKHNADELRAVVVDRRAVQAHLDALEDKWAHDTISDEGYRRNRRTMQRELDSLDTRISTLRGSTALRAVGNNLTANWDTLDADGKRAVFLSLVSEIRISPARPRKGWNNSRMDPDRIRFVFRSEALVDALGWNQQTEAFDDDRVKALFSAVVEKGGSFAVPGVVLVTAC